MSHVRCGPFVCFLAEGDAIMRKTFFGYYRLSEDEFAELWEKCVFILDANVLLNLYRYPKEARDDLIRILKGVSDRLWVPHQAALEYQQNRLDVIAEQVSVFQKVRSYLRKSKADLEKNLDGLQLDKRHSAIDPAGILRTVGDAHANLIVELDTLEEAQPAVSDDDEIRDEIDSLLEGKVGPAPPSQEKLDAIYKEGETRYQHMRPPGYLDADKSERGKENSPYVHDGLVFRREYGDLVLWNEIISEAQSREDFKHIIFITNDAKDDWWWTVESQGKKTIGPRPELVEEIVSRAEVSLFHMYNSANFMKHASKYLQVAFQDASVEQVLDITQLEISAAEMPLPSPSQTAKRAVLAWLRGFTRSDKVVESVTFPEFVATNRQTGTRSGYHALYIGKSADYDLRSREVALLAHMGSQAVKKGDLDDFTWVLVLDDPEMLEAADGLTSRIIVGDSVMGIVGLLATVPGAEGPVVTFSVETMEF